MGIRAVNRADQIKTVKVPVPDDLGSGPGSWVEVVGKFRVEDRQEINTAVVMAIREARGAGVSRGESETQVKTATLQHATILQGLKAWGGPIFCQVDHDSVEDHDESSDLCKPLHVNDRNILDLDDNIGQWLMGEINARNPLPVSGSNNGRSNTA